MKLKKVLFLMLIGLLSIGLLAGCGSKNDGGESAKDSEEKIVIRWGHFGAADDPLELGVREMAKAVAEKTNGRVEIKSFPNSQLGSIEEMYQQLQEGSLQMMYMSASEIGNSLPDFTIFDAPFVFEDKEHTREFARSDFAQAMAKKLLQEKNIRVLDSSAIFGARHLSTKATEVHSPADVKGLKIRVHQAQSRVDVVKAWGGNPVVTPTSEMYVAMQTGLAEAQESPLSWQAKNKYWEVQKYVMLTSHFIQNENVVVNEDFYKTLPEDIQEILKEEAIKLSDYVTEEYAKLDVKAIDELKANGMVIVEDIDKAAFKKASESVWDKYADKWGQGTPKKVSERDYKVLSPEEWQKF